MQVKKQQLELDMEQQTGSKLRKEYFKAIYYHPAYLTSMQSLSLSLWSLSHVRLLQPHRMQPDSLLCPWDSPGKNTGVGCHFLLQGNLPDLGIERRSPKFQADSLPTEL